MKKMPTARVIVTRPEPDGAAFARKLAEYGVESIASPVLVVRYMDIAREIHKAGAVLFTSANGVRAYSAGGGSVEIPAFVIGVSTAEAARTVGFASIAIGDGDVGSLAELAGNRLNAKPAAGDVLHIGGQEQTGDLVGQLGARGIKAQRVVAYAADPAAALSAAAQAAIRSAGEKPWVAHFSSRSAIEFLRLANEAGLEAQLWRIGCACFSAAVADAAGAGWRQRVIATSPNGDALIEAILNAK